MAGYRLAFNRVIEQLQKEYSHMGFSHSYMEGRKMWTYILQQERPWLFDSVPAHTIYGAMQDAVTAYQGVVRKWAQGTEASIPWCRKKTQRSFFILGNAVTEGGIYPRKLGKLRSSEPLPFHPSDGRVLTECGKWYLIVPETKMTKFPDNQGRVVSLDPGVRAFLTAFSPVGLHKIGDGAFGRITRLCQRLDQLLSRASNEGHRKKRAMYKAAAKARRKIQNLIDDLHYQALGWLARNFDTWVIPESNFTTACNRATRKIRSKTVRSLLTFAFARFRDRARCKAEVEGKTLVLVNEAWTSKTHNVTGNVIHNLGGRKTITSDGATLDRDINGALGIFLKGLCGIPPSAFSLMP